MKIYDEIDGVLSGLNIPFFDTMPSFAEDEEPELYVVYSIYETPDLYGGGKIVSTKYSVTVNVIGSNVKDVDELHEKVKKLLIESGFVYGGGRHLIDPDYPTMYRRILDFNFYD